MKPAKLACPYAKYNAQMNIECGKIDDVCVHQRWCAYKGWSVLTDRADDCKARRSEPDERKAKTAKKRRNKV